MVFWFLFLFLFCFSEWEPAGPSRISQDCGRRVFPISEGNDEHPEPLLYDFLPAALTLLQEGCGVGRMGALTSAATVWSSLSPGHWAIACRLPTLPRVLSSACSASRSFWCSEQAARCSESSCLRDSGEGRAMGF